MKLLIFSDIHSNHAALERLMTIEADYYFAAGDLVNWGRGLDACGKIMAKRADKVYVLPGNHESEDQIAGFCTQFGFRNFHGRTPKIGQHHVAGLGYSSPTPFNTPGEYSEAEMANRLSAFQKLNRLVLICHAPPYGTALDRIRDGVHGGSRSVREFIDRHQPEYFFCGHIHEAEGAETQIGKTKAANVGKRGYLLELD
ncbi:MAG TPA: metallophosphoesterase [Bryobacteraceae bacterium]|nr:metallophosphoesterase [Bryobacteraceae bacterium]